ncbi:hypothetical protein O6H91_05G016100 [Diphasiastrum complanatum]|uniref:Uncharacterized protein n=1 Tax=Diphasiastrum complanatum TaxID=34168 RepID=A0ACC2DKU3_DIPCM|nr:hypothetical protein O6H91_05G016100 [Diphasiastrum complanatum]
MRAAVHLLQREARRFAHRAACLDAEQLRSGFYISKIRPWSNRILSHCSDSSPAQLQDLSLRPWQRFCVAVKHLSTSADGLTSYYEHVLDNKKEKSGPFAEYERRIASGALLAGDKSQEDALRVLQALYDEILEKASDGSLEITSADDISNSKGRGGRWFWSNLFSMGQSFGPSYVKGLYMYGGVGTGKTMLMDMFYEELPGSWKKKRMHFHDFMLSVHSRLQGMSDPLGVVAEELTEEALLLCIDEFMVTDVADALILNRLFGHLFKRGIILVSTSNRAPDRLYEGGLQRDLFLPFIASLKERCIIYEIGSTTDYRKLTAVQKGFYFCGEGASELLREKFRYLTNGESPSPATVEVVMGRKLKVPLAASGCAFFQFHELCEMPLGAADYFGLFQHFHTLALDGVPKFGSHNRVSAYRFVTLIDIMYEHKARFVCSAEAAPIDLFEHVVTIADAPKRGSGRSNQSEDADVCVDNELGFAKERTISRLTEMQSKEYLEDFVLSHTPYNLENTEATKTGT